MDDPYDGGGGEFLFLKRTIIIRPDYFHIFYSYGFILMIEWSSKNALGKAL